MTSSKDFVFGRHAGLDYLKTQSADKINKVFLQHGIQEDFANQVYAICKKKRLVIQNVPKNKLDRLVDGGNHQGLVLAISSFEYADLSKLLDQFDDEGKEPFLLMLDSIEDPQSRIVAMSFCEPRS